MNKIFFFKIYLECGADVVEGGRGCRRRPSVDGGLRGRGRHVGAVAAAVRVVGLGRGQQEALGQVPAAGAAAQLLALLLQLPAKQNGRKKNKKMAPLN